MEVELHETPSNDLHLSELQRKANELLDGIRDVDEDIRKVTGRNYQDIRRFSSRNNRRRVDRDRLPRVDEASEEKDVNRKRHHEREKTPDPVMSEVVRDEKTELVALDEKEPVLDEETCKRSKRMFSHLLGTLQKFKKESENQKDIVLKRQEIEKKLEERDVKEHELALAQRKELFQLRLEKQRDLRNLRRQIWLKELEEKSAEYFDTLSSSILVGGAEPLLYMPAKHSPATLLMLEKTKEIFIKRKDEYIRLIPDFFVNNDPALEENQNDDKEHSSHDSSSNDEEENEHRASSEKILATENKHN